MLEKSKIKDARQEISVKFDSEKGEIVGFEAFLAKLEDVKPDVMNNYIGGLEDLQEGAKKMKEKLRPGDYTLT